ncbi:class I SAM-dependent methyltransferase [Longitalea arenae]|uniref:class I SAM-dependent methyltransferase n=1 Tax=Longitalea arenae TaxID=2812558 RepID=UPI001967966D|nr:class I SAM-dependent methyltransferase [Longitalea arenae]
MKPNDRFSWALSLMDLQPDHQVLEIGCGVGLAIEQIIPLLKTGSVTAIDRSASAIDKACKRNAAAIADNKVKLLSLDLLQLQDHKKKYDKVFAFNINLFWTKRSITAEAVILRSLLKQNGLMYILYGPLVGGIKKIEGPLIANMERESFVLHQLIHDRTLNCCCFIVKAN